MFSRQHIIKLVVIAGIRAQFIKLAAFQNAVKQWDTNSLFQFKITYINTGQHYDDDLAGSFINELGVYFDIDLTGSYQDLRPIRLFGDMVMQLHDILASMAAIDWVIVFGDANSTLAGALAAAKLGIKVIHIEAGLRTGNFSSPEEVNRIVSDHVAAAHFASSQRDLNNLAREGLIKNAFWTGDLVGDLIGKMSQTIAPALSGYQAGDYILASIHREENVKSDETLRNVITSLGEYWRTTVFIAHPRVRIRLQELKLHKYHKIQYIDSLSYKDMLSAIKGCAFLVTDSGAFQREAYYLRKRCVICQDFPFWLSLVEAGIHRSVKGSLDDLRLGLNWVEQAISTSEYPIIDDFGDGESGKKILQLITQLSIL